MKRPDWIRARVPGNGTFHEVRKILEAVEVKTVCREAECPNICECWSRGEATFIILGDICTRGCLFCNVKSGRPLAPDLHEPRRVAAAVKELKTKYAVITSVTRDDLADRGFGHFTRTVLEIRDNCPGVSVEVLIPDLFSPNGDPGPSQIDNILRKLVLSRPAVIAHNVEMAERLYPKIRKGADYRSSISLLSNLNSIRDESNVFFLKSSIMVGLGEEYSDIDRTLEDIRSSGVDIVCIGQYLSPSEEHWPVGKFYSPEDFADIREMAIAKGFRAVMSSVLVRGSYRAYEIYSSLANEKTMARI